METIELLKKIKSNEIKFDFCGHEFYSENEKTNLINSYIEELENRYKSSNTNSLYLKDNKLLLSNGFTCSKCNEQYSNWEFKNNIFKPINYNWNQMKYDNFKTCEEILSVPDTSDVNMLFSISIIKNIILDNKENIRKLIVKLSKDEGYHYLDARIDGNKLVRFFTNDLTITEDEYGNSLITDLSNLSEISNLFNDYNKLFLLFQTIGINTKTYHINVNDIPLESDNNLDIKNIMFDFAKETLKSLHSKDNKQIIKITDFDDNYFIAHNMNIEIYNQDKNYLDENLINFKCRSKQYIVFELDKYPKNRYNICGGDDLYKDNEESWFRSILLSYYFFGDFEELKN